MNTLYNKQYTKATIITILIFANAMLFGGYFLNQETGTKTIKYIKYLKYTSFFHHTYSALMINEFSDLDLKFNPIGFPSININGQEYLNEFGININEYTISIIGLIIIILFSFIITTKKLKRINMRFLMQVA